MHTKTRPKPKQPKAIVHRKPADVVPSGPVPERWLDRVLEDVWGRPFPSLWRPDRWLAETLIPAGSPSTDVYQEGDDVVVKAELPGMTREDVEVALAGDVLTVKGEKKREQEVKEQDYHRRERFYGAFVRSVSLPCSVKGAEARATFKDGVLEVRLPKTEEARKRSISVKIG